MLQSPTERAEEDAREKNEAFEKFLSNPTTQLLISLIPPSQTEDAVKTVLLTAFDAGYSIGLGRAVKGIIKAMMSKEERR